jgi:hypothetical protein
MSNDTLKALIKAAGIISALYLFLVGIAGMSSAIKSMGLPICRDGAHYN